MERIQNKQPSMTKKTPSEQVQIIRVISPLALPTTLDYLWAGDTPPSVGQMVEVEIGRKASHAMVIELLDESPFKKLKPAYPLSLPVLSSQTVQFYQWVSRYTLAMPGDALRAGLIGAKVPEKPLPETKIKLSGIKPKRITLQREKVLNTASEHLWTVSEISEICGVSEGVIRALEKDGVFERIPVESEDKITINLLPLSSAQEASAKEIRAALHRSVFHPILLDGVMGSGKTEVYFDAIASLLEKDEKSQVLVLVPEISLTSQWLSRFKKRFGFTPDCWHSEMSEGAKKRTWWKVIEGKSRVVVGARSALFLPYQNLRFIVVDEEHDHSYKQEDVFRYHGRDMSVTLAHIWKCPIILASATPSLETWHNTESGKYQHLILPKRHGEARLPTIKTVDMRQSSIKSKDKWVSSSVKDAISKRLEKGEQSLIFLNRRGYAPLLICGGCGHRQDCPRCDASVVVHGERLICHHCGYQELPPEHCPKCGEKDKFRAFGPGTRKVLEELKNAFPHARIDVADSDAITTKNKMDNLVNRMEEGEIDILVGTQMIAKGHHFPNLTLVGVIDGDMGLAHGELRAAEKTFQLLMQVAGRAGREEKHGEVLLQTYDSDNKLYETLKKCDRDAFYAHEMQNRRTWNDPPFSREVALILSGKNERDVANSAQELRRQAPEKEGIEVLGPAPAPIAKLRDNYRYRLLLKSNKPLQKDVQNWIKNTPIRTGVRVYVDVDPVSFM